MKRRTFAIVMLLMAMVMVFNLTSCGGSNSAGENTTTADEVSTTEPKEEAEKLGTLSIQRLEKISLEDDSKLPYTVKLYDTATSAYNHPIAIKAKSEEDCQISFSFTIDQGSVERIFSGLYIESDESTNGVNYGTINWVGDIQTFSLKVIPRKIDDTVVYKIRYVIGTDTNGMNKYEEAFIAFRVNRDFR